MTLLASLQQLGRPRLLVFGDLILDRYRSGNVERVSPEAPVLVLAEDAQEMRAGGAASVAALARGLDAEVALAGVVGDDPEGKTLRTQLEAAGIDTLLVLEDSMRPTTVKERLMGRAAGRRPHQMLRVDREVTCPLRMSLEQSLAAALLPTLDRCQALLISDYRKGCCTPQLLHTLIAAARVRNVPVLVDPARVEDYGRYRGATLVAPNRAEASLATGATITQPSEALVAARRLRDICRAQAVVVKLDSDGMVFVEAGGAAEHVPTTPRELYDVTGAGDMVLAVLGLAQAAKLALAEAVRLANAAAGLEVERLGVALVTRGQVAAEVATGASRLRKRVSLDEMVALAEAYRLAGASIVVTNGCFDLLHVGHAHYLEEAAQLGDVLVVAVNSDQSVRSQKGPGRPVIGQEDRAALVSALGCVDHVVVFDELTPHELLHRIRPDVVVKGGTYVPGEVVGREIVEGYGGQVCVTRKVEGVSTTRILASICRQKSGQEDETVI
jgi:D-beta-D-heptose 7-phosphate kinase/D-beta-D-heptose 1-phosphate adenosyltransferase